MLLLVVVFAGLAIWALGQRSEAQKQAEVARSQALAASAVSQLDADPELGLLLAVEAAEGKPTREAEDALRRALTSSRLRAVVPTRGPVRSVAISPDDSRVLTVDGRGDCARAERDRRRRRPRFLRRRPRQRRGFRSDRPADRHGEQGRHRADRRRESRRGTAGDPSRLGARRGRTLLPRRAPRAHRFEGRRRPHLRRANGQASGGSHAFARRCGGTSSARAARRFS